MIKYKVKEFDFEEDFIISAECEDCGYYTEDENDFENNCPECGGNLINETSHEDCKCSICNCRIDIWEDAYRYKKEHDILICKECYEKLENEENVSVPTTILSTEKTECNKCKHYWMNKGSGVNPDDICYGENDYRSCRVHEDYAWKFEAK